MSAAVFYDHIYGNSQLRHVVERLMELRKNNGIHCRSAVKILKAERDVYVAEIDDKLIMKIGPGDFAPAGEYSIGEVAALISTVWSDSAYGTKCGAGDAWAARYCLDCP